MSCPSQRASHASVLNCRWAAAVKCPSRWRRRTSPTSLRPSAARLDGRNPASSSVWPMATWVSLAGLFQILWCYVPYPIFSKKSINLIENTNNFNTRFSIPFLPTPHHGSMFVNTKLSREANTVAQLRTTKTRWWREMMGKEETTIICLKVSNVRSIQTVPQAEPKKENTRHMQEVRMSRSQGLTWLVGLTSQTRTKKFSIVTITSPPAKAVFDGFGS